MTNPLHRPEPRADESPYDGKFYFADGRARLVHGSFPTRVHVTPDMVWITGELAIPAGAIDDVQVIEAGVLPRRRAVAISFRNPITGQGELVCLCRPDVIGLYRTQPLHELMGWIEQARAPAPVTTPVPTAAAMAFPASADVATAGGCEACGAMPASYVSYSFLVSLILISYRSAPRRRVHCNRHNLMYGLPCYLLTVLTGWCGIGVFGYPFMVFGTARSLAPSLGRLTYVLGVLPTLTLAALVVWWLAR
jgi:hypothetical protein